MFKDNWN